MLEFINEYKRRKDLVSKYLTSDPSDATWSEKMKKLNMRTLKKKSNRITYQISNASSNQVSMRSQMQVFMSTSFMYSND